MVSQYIWIGIIVGVFVVGIGVGYGIFGSQETPTLMIGGMNSMMNDPQMAQQMMNQMMQDPEMMDQMMTSMMQNSEHMMEWMDTGQHAEQMSEMMSNNHDFMMAMMAKMLEDPSIRLQMIGHMTEEPETVEMFEQMMGSQEMMGEGMVSDSMMSNMQFNVDAPITMPMIDGYYNGEKVFFVHTEVSDKNMADMMSMMINFPTLHVSDLTNIPQSELSKVYVFTSGIPGSGPYGGGPFMFQIDVFDSVPGQMGYSQFRVPYLVTWNDDSTPRILTSEAEILEAESNGELTIQKTENVVNAPMMVWKSGGMEQRASMIQRMFESMPGVDGEITNIDVDNYIVMMKLHSQNSMGMMGSGMMNP